MKKLLSMALMICVTAMVFAQTNTSIVNQNGINGDADVDQVGTLNYSTIIQDPGALLQVTGILLL